MMTLRGRCFLSSRRSPPGSVATYGQLGVLDRAAEKCASGGARAFATQNTTVISPVTALSTTPAASRPGWSEQADLLRAEGAAFKDETHVDLRQSLWLRAD